MKKLFGEYRDFINQGNVITVAVGLVMALYFKSIVDAFINGVIMPIVSAIVGEENFDEIDFGIGDATIEVGLVIQALIMFLVVALVLFLIIKAYNTYIAKPAQEATTRHRAVAAHRDPRRAALALIGCRGRARRRRVRSGSPPAMTRLRRFLPLVAVALGAILVPVAVGSATAPPDTTEPASSIPGVECSGVERPSRRRCQRRSPALARVRRRVRSRHLRRWGATPRPRRRQAGADDRRLDHGLDISPLRR